MLATENVFTYHPQISGNSSRIAESLTTDFETRQRKHVEKQKRLLQQASRQFRSPPHQGITGTLKTKQDLQSDESEPDTADRKLEPLPTGGMAAECTAVEPIRRNDPMKRLESFRNKVIQNNIHNKRRAKFLEACFGDMFVPPGFSYPYQTAPKLRPYSYKIHSNLHSKSSPRLTVTSAHSNPASIPSITETNRINRNSLNARPSAPALPSTEQELNLRCPSADGLHGRSNTVPPIHGPRLRSARQISRSISLLNDANANDSSRLRQAKLMADSAIQQRKIFMIQGPYHDLRVAFRARGWVEKFYTPVKREPRSRLRKSTDAKGAASDDDDDDGDDTGDTDHTDDDADDSQPDAGCGEGRLRPWEECNGVYGFMSRTVKNHPPMMIWTVRRDYIDYRFLRKDQIVNHYARAGAFTTKVGLCQSLKNLMWYENQSAATFFPRCYRLSADEDKQDFIDDFRLTACICVLKILIERMEVTEDMLKLKDQEPQPVCTCTCNQQATPATANSHSYARSVSKGSSESLETFITSPVSKTRLASAKSKRGSPGGSRQQSPRAKEQKKSKKKHEGSTWLTAIKKALARKSSPTKKGNVPPSQRSRPVSPSTALYRSYPVRPPTPSMERTLNYNGATPGTVPLHGDGSALSIRASSPSGRSVTKAGGVTGTGGSTPTRGSPAPQGSPQKLPIMGANSRRHDTAADGGSVSPCVSADRLSPAINASPIPTTCSKPPKAPGESSVRANTSNTGGAPVQTAANSSQISLVGSTSSGASLRLANTGTAGDSGGNSPRQTQKSTTRTRKSSARSRESKTSVTQAASVHSSVSSTGDNLRVPGTGNTVVGGSVAGHTGSAPGSLSNHSSRTMVLSPNKAIYAQLNSRLNSRIHLSASGCDCFCHKQKKLPREVPVWIVETALKECQKFIQFKNHDDLDMHGELEHLPEGTWEVFLTWYYILAHEDGAVAECKAYLGRAKELIEALKPHWPQMELDGTRNVWIVKPGAKSRGRGVICYNRLHEMLKLVSSNMTREGKFVVQKYIERPILVDNMKFDIRQWFLVTDWNPLTIWFYQDCYLRFCSRPFTLNDFHEAIHLSNNCIQKHYEHIKVPRSDKIPDDNMWTHTQFVEFLREQGASHAWDRIIYPGMKQAIISALETAQDSVEYRKASFELYGADFMLTSDYSPWLIEINSSPSMATTTVPTARLCPAVLDDTLKVVLDRRFDRNASTGRFELAFRQPLITVPTYLGLNLSVEGKTIQQQRVQLSSQSLEDMNGISAGGVGFLSAGPGLKSAYLGNPYLQNLVGQKASVRKLAARGGVHGRKLGDISNEIDQRRAKGAKNIAQLEEEGQKVARERLTAIKYRTGRSQAMEFYNLALIRPVFRQETTGRTQQ